MRRPVFLFFVLSLLLSIAFVQKATIPTVKATIQQGDLVIDGNTVYTIEGRLDINGSIVVKENATLILQNAIINFTQSVGYEHNMTLRDPLNGKPRLQSSNSTITSNLNFVVELFQNSSATISNSTDTCYLSVHDSAIASISNSTIAWLTIHESAFVTVFNSTISTSLQAFSSPIVSISNSTIESLFISSSYANCSVANIEPSFYTFWNYLLNSSVVLLAGGSAPNLTVRNTEIDNWYLNFWASNATITDSKLVYLFSDYYSNVRLINTTAFLISPRNWGKVYVSWYLDVHVVDAIDQDVTSANVTAYYPNATVAETKSTDIYGRVRLILLEKMMNSTGDYPIGNYTIEASYETHSNGITANMTENKQLMLALDFIVPEFPPLLILPLFMIATLLTVVIYKKRTMKIERPVQIRKTS